MVVTVNNDDSDYVMTLPAGNAAQYLGALSGERVSVVDGRIVVNVKRNSGDIWVPIPEGQDAEPEYKEMPGTSVSVQENQTISEEPIAAPSVETAPASATETLVSESSIEKPADTPATEKTTRNLSDTSEKTQVKAQKSESTEYWWKITTTDTEDADLVKTPDAEFAAENSVGTLDAETTTEDPVKTSDAEMITENPAGTSDTETATEDLVKTSDAESATEDHTKTSDAVPAAENPAKASAESDAEIFEKGRIAGLQEAILAIMEKNGPVTDQMRRDVMENTHHDSLITWVKSFR